MEGTKLSTEHLDTSIDTFITSMTEKKNLRCHGNIK